MRWSHSLGDSMNTYTLIWIRCKRFDNMPTNSCVSQQWSVPWWSCALLFGPLAIYTRRSAQAPIVCPCPARRHCPRLSAWVLHQRLGWPRLASDRVFRMVQFNVFTRVCVFVCGSVYAMQSAHHLMFKTTHSYCGSGAINVSFNLRVSRSIRTFNIARICLYALHEERQTIITEFDDFACGGTLVMGQFHNWIIVLKDLMCLRR